MKIMINQNEEIQETEVIINCSSLDRRIRNLTDYIRQYSTSLEGSIGNSTYYVSLDSVLYIDSVDKKTFFYDRNKIYSSQYTLSELQEKLKNTLFVRISKNCIVNLAYVRCTIPCTNRRLELVMTNGEHLIVGRAYFENFRQRNQAYHSDAFLIPAFPAKEIFEHDLERSVYNAGKIIGFSDCPKRVVALSYEAAELLAALGAAERLVAIMSAESGVEYVLPQWRPALENIPIVTNDSKCVPTLSGLRDLNADFIFGSYYALCTLKRKNLSSSDNWGINLYISEGTIPERANMESVYKDILNIGRIFHVEKQAIDMVEQFRTRVRVITRELLYRNPVSVFVYDSGLKAPRTSMKYTLENHLISIAGGKNIFGDDPRVHGVVTWEQIAENAPDVIVVHDYIDLLNAEEKISHLKNQRELKDVPAVRNNRFVVLSQLEVLPGIQNVNAIEKLIRGFFPDLLL